MPNILTAAEAANFIRSTSTDAIMLQYLPLVDAYLKNATGHNWAGDSTISDTAKLAAGMVLTYWYDNPTMIGQAPASVAAALAQLEAEAQKWRRYAFNGLDGGGSIYLPGAREGDTVVSLVGVVGLAGSQSAKFESVITEDNSILQTSSLDLDECQFVVVLKHPADDVSA